MKTKKTVFNEYHLIILDASLSMQSIKQAAISGVNSVLDSVRTFDAHSGRSIANYVTIHAFDGFGHYEICDRMPISRVPMLTDETYVPRSTTPLYDAIGLSLTKLRSATQGERCSVAVTIVTDGCENASYRYCYDEVVALITNLSSIHGWTFAYMGADHDVEDVAAKLNIHNVRRFQHNESETRQIFEREAQARARHLDRINQILQDEPDLTYEEEVSRISLLNADYYSDSPTSIFVFGSNINGRHNGGSALKALSNYGAIYGKGEGLQGESYAIPTAGVSFDYMRQAIERFCLFALSHPHYYFNVTAIGCGHAGYTPGQIAPLFASLANAPNVHLPREFKKKYATHSHNKK